MKFCTDKNIEGHIKQAKHIGAIINDNPVRFAMELACEHDSFVISSHDGGVIADCVSITPAGRFICVLIDTRRASPLSYVVGNACDLPATSIETISHTLATVITAFRVLEAEKVAA